MSAGNSDSLSNRERECLQLLAKPMRPKEVAYELGLSVKTVEMHLASAKRKLKARDPLHAARMIVGSAPAIQENFPGEIIPIEGKAIVASDQAEPTDDERQQGRLVKLDKFSRTGLILGSTALIIVLVLVLISSADIITRLAAGYYSSHTK